MGRAVFNSVDTIHQGDRGLLHPMAYQIHGRNRIALSSRRLYIGVAETKIARGGFAAMSDFDRTKASCSTSSIVSPPRSLRKSGSPDIRESLIRTCSPY